MVFSVSNDGIKWSLDFGPDSVILSVKDLVQEMRLSSQEFALAAKKLLLSQRRQFLNNHLARVPITPNQQGTHEITDEALSSAGAQEGLDTSGYQVSADLDDVELYWAIYQLDVDAASRPSIATPFSPTAFDDSETGGSAENPVCLTKRKTRKTLLQQQQHHSLRDQHKPLHC